jgi:hypothetical protein
LLWQRTENRIAAFPHRVSSQSEPTDNFVNELPP